MAGNFRQDVLDLLKPGKTYEALRQPFYDVTVQSASPIAAATVVSLFQVPLGSGTGVAAGVKGIVDTNLRLNGQIPADHVFELWSPRLVIGFDLVSGVNAPGVNQHAEVMNAILYGASLVLRIATYPKMEIPAFMLPAAAGPQGTLQSFQAAAAAWVTNLVTNGSPDQTSAFQMSPFPLVIPPTQVFSWDLTFHRAVTFAAPITKIFIWVVMDGILHRPAMV